MRVPFDEFVLDTDSRELLRGGRAVALSPKAFQLLRALLESRPKALSRTALQDLLWPDAVVVDANLSNLIGEVRTALGDDPRKPRFIRTVHRFGYAFRGEPEAGRPPARSGTIRVRLKWPGGSVELGEGEHVLGRDADAAVCVASRSVSRRHAVLRIRSDRMTLEDLGSKNGTSLNAQRVDTARAVADGDEIRAGSVRLKVRLMSPALTTETTVVSSDGD
jgi:DNA-binding winged helix-turn-helix (wHTH) protein